MSILSSMGDGENGKEWEISVQDGFPLGAENTQVLRLTASDNQGTYILQSSHIHLMIETTICC